MGVQDEDLLTESFSARRKCFTIFQRITVVSNIIFGLFALLLIVLGSVAIKELKEYSFVMKVSIPAGLIVLGIFLLAIIALGIAGSFKKSTKLLGAYFILLFIFIICEFGVGGGAYGFRDKIPDEASASWIAIDDADRSNLQYSFTCCGWANLTDNAASNCYTYKPDANYTGNWDPVPKPSNWVIPENGTNITSCEDLVVDFFNDQLYAVGTAGIVFAVLQLLALISSIIVFAFIKIEQRRSQDERF